MPPFTLNRRTHGGTATQTASTSDWDEFRAVEIFEGIRDARSLTASWRDECNTQRPHSSLCYQTPAEFAAAYAAFTSAKASAQAAH